MHSFISAALKKNRAGVKGIVYTHSTHTHTHKQTNIEDYLPLTKTASSFFVCFVFLRTRKFLPNPTLTVPPDTVFHESQRFVLCGSIKHFCSHAKMKLFGERFSSRNIFISVSAEVRLSRHVRED